MATAVITVSLAIGCGARTVAPDRRTVAYASGLDLHAVDWTGANDRVLARGPYARGCCDWGYGHPAFARDPNTVYFATVDHFESVGIDGTHRRTLVSGEFPIAVFPNAAVSPDRLRIAAGIGCRGTQSLRVWSLAALPAGCETGAVVTAAHASIEGNESNDPAWGPGDRIVFQQDRDLYVVDAAGGVARNLTAALTGGDASSAGAAYPAWVPLGAPLP